MTGEPNASFASLIATEKSGLDPRDARIDRLETLLLDIALIADGHRKATLYINGENVALSNILTMAAFGLGKDEQLRENGTLLAPVPTSKSYPQI